MQALQNVNLNAELQRFAELISEQTLAEWQEEYGTLTIADIYDKAGYNAVVSALQVVKRPRLRLEELRKELKRDALVYGRAIDDRAKELTALFQPIEDHLKAERERIDNQKAVIEKAAKTAKEIADCWDEAHAANVQHDEQEAEAVRLIAQRVEQERIAVEQAAKQAEIDRKQAEIERKEREARIAAEAAAKAKAEAEAAAERKIAEAEADRKIAAAKEEARREAEQKTVEAHTSPKGAYEALVCDLAKLLNCAENEQAIKDTIAVLMEAASIALPK